MSAFDLALVKMIKKDFIVNGGNGIDESFPCHVVRRAWAEARVVLGV